MALNVLCIYVCMCIVWQIGPINPIVFSEPLKYNCTLAEDAETIFNPLTDIARLFPEGHPQQDVQIRYNAFTAKYGRTFSTQTQLAKKKEIAIRTQIFHNNLRYVNSMNRRKLSFALALNHLADWTGSEMVFVFCVLCVVCRVCVCVCVCVFVWFFVCMKVCGCASSCYLNS